MTLIEAQACGLPSVVTDFKYGATDIVNDGCNGLIAELYDRTTLVNAIDRMMASEEMRREYGKNAIEASKRFYKDNIMGKWIDLIKGVSATT